MNWIVDMSSAGAAIGYGYTSLAALKLALEEKNIPVAITGVVGSVFSLIFLVLLLVPIKVLNCSLGKEPYICLIVWIILGIVFYIFSNRKNKEVRS